MRKSEEKRKIKRKRGKEEKERGKEERRKRKRVRNLFDLSKPNDFSFIIPSNLPSKIAEHSNNSDHSHHSFQSSQIHGKQSGVASGMFFVYQPSDTAPLMTN